MRSTARLRFVATLALTAALLGGSSTRAGAPWQSVGRFFGIGHGPGYHAAPGCPGACGTYCPAPCGWCGEAATFPIPRTGWMPIAQPTIVTSSAYQHEAVPAILVPTVPTNSVLVPQ